MKIAKSAQLYPVPDQIIARLGRVRLVGRADGRHELVGGMAQERVAAKAWCERLVPFFNFAEPHGLAPEFVIMAHHISRLQ